MTLKKIQIAEAIANKLGLPLARTKAITETLLEIMKGSDAKTPKGCYL